MTIDLSWRSSQIERNTYSSLETEHLLTEKETVAGKTKDKAIMFHITSATRKFGSTGIWCVSFRLRSLPT